MNVVVVYDSLFGNTRAVAEAIADGARSASSGSVHCTPIGAASSTQVESVDLLVVGGPTHAFGLSSRRSRASYLRREDLAAGRSRSGHHLEPGADGPGLREWLETLPHAAPTRPPGAAAFDTKLDRAFSGSAAGRIHRRLRRLGYRMVVPARSFFVAAMEGPLPDGELERAKTWGAELVRTYGASVPSPRSAVTTRQRDPR